MVNRNGKMHNFHHIIHMALANKAAFMPTQSHGQGTETSTGLVAVGKKNPSRKGIDDEMTDSGSDEDVAALSYGRPNKKKRGEQNPRQGSSEIKCYFCGKKGHIKRDCWKRKEQERSGKGMKEKAHWESAEHAYVKLQMDRSWPFWILEQV